MVDVQPVEDEHSHCADGAVREVEDARGLVGENEPDGCEPVDRPPGETDDDECQKFAHARRPESFRPLEMRRLSYKDTSVTGSPGICLRNRLAPHSCGANQVSVMGCAVDLSRRGSSHPSDTPQACTGSPSPWSGCTPRP